MLTLTGVPSRINRVGFSFEEGPAKIGGSASVKSVTVTVRCPFTQFPVDSDCREAIAKPHVTMATSPTNKRSAIKNLLKGSMKVPSQSPAFAASSSSSEKGNHMRSEEKEKDVEGFLDSLIDGEYSRWQFKRLNQLQATREAQEEQTYSIQAGKNAMKYELNRYTNILPYDYSRIRLIPTSTEYTKSVDYINASEVYTPGKHRRYIATQGPKDNTVDDFWRMVWDNVSSSSDDRVTTIIMLTQLVEGRSRKCAQYWPEQVGRHFDIRYRTMTKQDITLNVRLVSQTKDSESDAVISTIELSAIDGGSDTNPNYTIKHMLYKGWKDMDIPESTDTFLNYFRLYRQLHTSSASPVVHCSAGCGRTGVFIALDYLFTKVPSMTKDEILTDPVFHTVDEIRKWRGNMVFRPGQLQFVYDLFREMVLGKLRMPEIHG